MSRLLQVSQLALSPPEVAVLLDVFAVGAIIPLLPFVASSVGATPTQIGLLDAAYGFSQTIGSTIMGDCCDRWEDGRRKVLLISFASTALAYLCLGFASSLWVLVFSRLLAGMFKHSITAAQAYVADTSTKVDRAGALGRLSMCVGIGYTLGPLLGTFLLKSGGKAGTGGDAYWKPACASAVIFAIDFLFVWFMFSPSKLPSKNVSKTAGSTSCLASTSPTSGTTAAPKPLNASSSSSSMAPESLWQRIVFLWVKLPHLRALALARVLFDFSYLLFRNTFTPYLRQELSFEAADVGMVMSYIGFLTIFSQGFMVKWCRKRWSEAEMLPPCVLALAALYLYFPAVSGTFEVLCFLLPFDVVGSVAKTSMQSLITLKAHSTAAPAEQQSGEGHVGLLLGVIATLCSVCRIVCPAIGMWLFSQRTVLPALCAGVITLSFLPLLSRTQTKEDANATTDARPKRKQKST